MTEGNLRLFRSCTPVVDAEFGPETDQSPAEVIVDAIATAADVDPLELPPLYETVDPELLDKLFESGDAASDETMSLSFEVDSWNVFVRGDGKIRVCDGTQPTDPEPVFADHSA